MNTKTKRGAKIGNQNARKKDGERLVKLPNSLILPATLQKINDARLPGEPLGKTLDRLLN